MEPRVVSSPLTSYSAELLGALQDARSFVLISGFATSAGLALLKPALDQVFERGGDGRIVLAVDRQGFNTAAMFESLLEMKESYGGRLALGVVLQETSLMHAKALLARSAGGCRLLVGSANLTRDALGANFELGVLIEASAQAEATFKKFVSSLPARSLDGPDARKFLEARGLLARGTSKPFTRSTPKTPDGGASLVGILNRLPPLAELEGTAEEHLASWVARGTMVGKGRRMLEALVLRLPTEALVQRGLLRSARKRSIGDSSHERRTVGYGIDLLPPSQAEAVRRVARRASLVLTKLTLNLPCFGSWMPDAYWDVFVAAREELRRSAELNPEQLMDSAREQAVRLSNGGLKVEIAAIIDSVARYGLLVDGAGDTLRDVLQERFEHELTRRRPEIIAACVEMRVARQSWSPFEKTDAPYRQLATDVIQACFSATYRTGDWPKRFKSFAARALTQHIASQLGAAKGASAEMALELIERAASWEDPSVSMDEVARDFRTLVGDRFSFAVPTMDELLGNMGHADIEEGEDDDEL